MKKQQSGFTLIELVMVIVILGILAASFAPKFVDLGTDATVAAKNGALGAVKSGFTVYIAQNKTQPTVSQLAGSVQGDGVTPVANGVQVTIDGSTYVAQTYTDAACTLANITTATTDVVQCIGTMTP